MPTNLTNYTEHALRAGHESEEARCGPNKISVISESSISRHYYICYYMQVWHKVASTHQTLQLQSASMAECDVDVPCQDGHSCEWNVYVATSCITGMYGNTNYTAKIAVITCIITRCG